MKHFISPFIFAIFSIANVLPPSCTAEPITATTGFLSNVLKIISFFRSSSSDSPSLTLQNNFYELMNAIDQIKISENLRSVKNELERTNELSSKDTNYFEQFSNLFLSLNKIEANYRAMLIKIQKMRNGTELNPVDKSITDVNVVDYLTSNSTLLETISNINYTFIIDETSTSKNMKDNGEITPTSSCSEPSQVQSKQQSLQKLFVSIVISQVKVLLTAQLAADYINRTKGYFPTQDFEDVSDPVSDQYQTTVNLFKKLMQGASQDVWVCDPQPHVENVTFIQLVNVFQQQIVDVKNFDDSESRDRNFLSAILDEIWPHGRSGKNVQSKVWGKHNVIPDFTTKYYDITLKRITTMQHVGPVFKYNSICQGYVWGCKFLNGLLNVGLDTLYLLCYSLPNSNRRFERIEAHKPNTEGIIGGFGATKPCDFSRNNRTIFLNSYVCTCDETLSVEPTIVRSHYSYRFFYTGLVQVSSKNYVVTGVKLGHYKGIVYLMIQEGRLLREGVIDPRSLRWIDPALGQENFTSSENLVRLHWEDRTIKLGDIDLPTNNVLTGLFFTRKNRNNGVNGPLRLALMYREFDFNTGITSGEDYGTIKDDYGINASYSFYYEAIPMVVLGNLPLPDLDSRSEVIETNKYLDFTTSNFKTDLGQTTIPYFDIQNVTMSVPVPMGGAGLYYKYTPGHAGFIGIKLKTYDISQHIAEPTGTLPQSVKEALQKKSSFWDGTLGIYKN